uniref:Fatty acid desaturase domain-containing protein n=1 Tax=Grammatophora oceanica TaxID=210454 RepID=A0A7S1V4D9_9STRA|mmetsp:Transcript_36357/g.54253  ORF Transcript_36357/g.54253 Transcript_36357/m.54253 type:complete len:446 (+) Transcript_36357:154-1491(+)|eukprot:CAMPEP_0194037100 /NCGR_PEP_ID=MMETSP0009_2-20130614/9448_1 /TAXON_ID=210454 /ORGANISM="Grammatophora oceanica, Strain CCMP 410" /LENGTH=445 /DNA_ID=CAMNT_0038679123 /DNA_START=142 /DNA_END=1479 /DNA_ORIENTATION=+
MCQKPSLGKSAAVESASTKSNTQTQLAKDDVWLKTFDFEGFSSEIHALGKKLEAQQGPSDVAHLEKMILWSNTLAAIGLLTMGFFRMNILTIFCLSTFTFTRWTMIAHHTCHGGFDKIHPQNKVRWHRFKFALGSLWRRFLDWFDWMMPEAWNVEHNNRHHYHLSELDDPDLVEENLKDLRELNMPVAFKYVVIFFFMTTWKWFYYAPNTYKELKLAKLRREGKSLPAGVKPEDAITIRAILLGQNPFYSAFEFFTVVVGPYFVFRFLITPLPYLLLGELGILTTLDGPTMYMTAVTNLFLAELLTNAHGFLCVVTNHAGDDMYRFRHACRAFSGSFYLRQVLASADYYYGNDVLDFLQGFLNYQVEHHMWPSLTMKSYQTSGPLVREICERYGVPYVQHNVFWRLKQTVDVMVGSANMKWFPEYYENRFLEMDAKMEAEKRKAK